MAFKLSGQLTIKVYGGVEQAGERCTEAKRRAGVGTATTVCVACKVGRDGAKMQFTAMENVVCPIAKTSLGIVV